MAIIRHVSERIDRAIANGAGVSLTPIEVRAAAFREKKLREVLRRFRDYASRETKREGAHHDPIWAEVADAIEGEFHPVR